MPILKNAKKALRSSLRKTVMNQRVKSRLKTAVDKAKSTPSGDTVSQAYSAVDKALKRHIVHRNKAARLKAQISRLLKQATQTAAKPVNSKPAGSKSTSPKSAVKKTASQKSLKKTKAKTK